MEQPDQQRPLNALEHYGELSKDEKYSFVVTATPLLFYRNLQKWSLTYRRVWHSQNTLPTAILLAPKFLGNNLRKR